MIEIVFTFKTTQAAISGERVLLDDGLKVKVMSLPSCLGAGCGLCLRTARVDLEEAVFIFEKFNHILVIQQIKQHTEQINNTKIVNNFNCI